MKWYDLLKATGPLGSIGWIFHLFDKNRNLFNGVGEGVNSTWNKITGAGLTGAEKEANAFSAEQADKQRAWEEEMRNTSYQAQVKDMQAAGLNTALMYGGTGASGATVPSSSVPSSVSPSSGGITDLLGSIMDFALLGAQKKNIEAQTDKLRSETGAINTLTPLQAQELESKIKEINQNVSESEARESLAIVQTFQVSKNTEWIDKINDVNTRLQESQIELNKAYESESKERVSEIEQRIKNYKQDIVESFSRMAVNAANAGYLDAATISAMEEAKLIEVRRAGARTEYLINEKVLENYDTDKWFIRAQQGFGAARDLGIGVGSVLSGGLFTPSPRKIGF